MKRLFYSLHLLLIFVIFQDISAQDRFERVEVLDHPRFSLNKRVVLDADLTFLPVDAYYKPLITDVVLSYQFSNWVSWEVIRAGFPIHNFDSGLNGSFETIVNQEVNSAYNELGSDKTSNFQNVSGQDLKDFKYRLGSMMFLNLLYSKSNWFNRKTVYHYWQAGLGGSYYDFGDESQQTIDIALRARFFLTEHFIFNFRIAQSIGFNKKTVRQMTQLGTGFGFAF